MDIEKKIFERSEIDFSKLLLYGFEKSANGFVYHKLFMNNEFEAIIQVDTDGNISGDVYETYSNEKFIPLRVESMSAGFAGKVRTEYEKILQKIKDNCCKINYFISPQANRLAQKIYAKYGDIPCFPWDKYSGYGVFKNLNNNKWYALIMNIDANKLNKNFLGKTEVVNIKLGEKKTSDFLLQKGFYPAYHMNKKNWITIILDDTVSDNLLFELLEESYAFALEKRAKNKNGNIA